MEDWKEILQDSVTTVKEVREKLQFDLDDCERVIEKYPMRVNPYYLGLIEKLNDPVWKQAFPDKRELHDHVCIPDPLCEESLSPVPNLVHKYPDRVLFLVSNKCAMYCRFCTRKRKVGRSNMIISQKTLDEGFAYIRDTKQVRDVLISGGDPLLLEDEQLDYILSSLHQINHVETIRIGTRVPCTLPMRVTPNLVNILKKYHPLYINTHFNHPIELTEQAHSACNMLADAGIPLGCQTVLLKGVNNDSTTLKSLFTSLLKMRVKPYYLFQPDLSQGTNHFRTTTAEGIKLMRTLYGNISGMAIPAYTLDAPNGGGKIPLTPNFILSKGEDLTFTNYLGELHSYPEVSNI